MEMRLTSKGQVTIPKQFRDALGIFPDSAVTFRLENGKLIVEKAASSSSASQRMTQALSGKGSVRLSTDEIMRLTRGDEE